MHSRTQNVQLIFKRCADVLVSLLGLIVLAGPLLLVAMAIRLDSPGPAFFLQRRLGKGGKPFRILKFRTMIDDAAGKGRGLTNLPNDSRFTRVGRFLRTTSIDELPQLVNILKGEMSLIGPRPGVPEHLEYYDPIQRRRLDVRPGVTGWAVVHGRAHHPWSVRIRYDVEYAEHFSLWLDLKILLKTIAIVLKRQNITHDFFKYGDAFDLLKPGETKEERESRLDV
jgi:undecaprenyl phosphate N,N'-diacetylbacillosamine 1-phosphate transferase